MQSPSSPKRRPSLLAQTRSFVSEQDSPTTHSPKPFPRGRAELSERREDRLNEQNGALEPSSPEDGGNFRKSLEINMKGLIGDAVGNMSISPASRDIVLAARRGLFIIDLEAPLEVPRFLPQGGRWDVADVQWNPHPSRAEYIVSTSSEKLLIWNLSLAGKSAIEHVLHKHYRAITDINWHNTEPDTVVSVGIDSWLWAWDLREPRKPTLGLSAFNEAGTQVKWCRQNPNMIASSHGNQVLIWDRRKGSLPVSQVAAHDSKIYGIDWAYTTCNEIVTCSLDKTIKCWRTDDLSSESGKPQPLRTIHTTYPVWRARNLPFGAGVLSLAQRGEAALEMYSHSSSEKPVERFEGHTDVVKEFVWRKGVDDEFQLITWSKDGTLRFWPVDSELMQTVGHVPASPESEMPPKQPTTSFRKLREDSEHRSTFSVPARGILAEVRAGPPHFRPHPRVLHSPALDRSATLLLDSLDGKNIPIRRPSARRGGTMSRGNVGGKSISQVDPLSWLSSVKVSERPRETSSGRGSEDRGGADIPSRLSSLSRGEKMSASVKFESRRSHSRTRSDQREEKKDEENQSLQSEITSVLNKLATSAKIKLEKHDLTKKRTCTLGLHGPWGEPSSVFIRVTFTFPREYPHSNTIPPEIDVEKNPLVSNKQRGLMHEYLRVIAEKKAPCFEECLKYLISGVQGVDVDSQSIQNLMDEGSSSEEDEPWKDRSSRHQSSKNNLEPRTSQGCFGPNGELVCFFRAPPRIVRNVQRGIADSPLGSGTPQRQFGDDNHVGEKLYQSPSLLSDAIQRLGSVSAERNGTVSIGLADKDRMSRIMTNLLTFSQSSGQRRPHEALLGSRTQSYSLVAPRRSTVFIKDTNHHSGHEKRVARDYIFSATTLVEVCQINAKIANSYGRFDHELVFRALGPLLPTQATAEAIPSWPGSRLLTKRIVDAFLAEYSHNNDIQMLAMLSTLMIQSCVLTASPVSGLPSKATFLLGSPATATPRANSIDYFSLSRTINNSGDGRPGQAQSPNWTVHSNSPHVTLSSSNSSRGSWSSLFNAGTMRQLVTGVQGSFLAPHDAESPTAHSIASRERKFSLLGPEPPSHRRRTSPQLAPPTVSRSWGEGTPTPVSPKSAFNLSPFALRPNFSRRNTTQLSLSERRYLRDPTPPAVIPLAEKRVVFFEARVNEPRELSLFYPQDLERFHRHVRAYAELLFAWELPHKRLELLKSIRKQDTSWNVKQHDIGILRKCPRCSQIIPAANPRNLCSSESCNFPTNPACSVCRIPVKGLSNSCMVCLHVTHVACWKKVNVSFCPSGCGCNCVSSPSPAAQRDALFVY